MAADNSHMVLEFTIMLCIIISAIFSLIAWAASNSLICYGTFVRNLKFTIQLETQLPLPFGSMTWKLNWQCFAKSLTAMRCNICLNRMRLTGAFCFWQRDNEDSDMHQTWQVSGFRRRRVYAKGGHLNSLNRWNLGHSAVAVQMSSHVTG